MKGNIVTEHGTMVVEFYEKDAPNTVNNFAKLAMSGFYDGLKFHRVIPGFLLVHERNTTQHLDGKHTCFGKITEGLDILGKVKQGDTFSVTIEGVENPDEIIVETRMKTGTF